ncbi:MAG: hypothetical protein WCI87_07570 [Euryarchaeota archaeon]
MGDIKTITSVPVGAFAMMYAALQAVLGLIFGIIYAIIILAGVAIPGGLSLGAGAVGAVLVIIVMVVGGFIFGYIGGAIVTLIYNWLVPKVGGFKLELE